jgi:transposase InsO family protein
MSDELLNGEQRAPEPGAQQEGADAGAAGAAERGRSPSAAEPAAPAAAGRATSSPPGFVGRSAQVGPAEEGIEEDEACPMDPLLPLLGRRRQQRKKSLSKPVDPAAEALTPEQRLLILDTWLRSGLPAGDFAGLVGVSKHTLYAWKKKFDQEGPSGLMDRSRGGPRGSKLSELTKRTILMLKQANPDWGCQRISDMLVRGPALPASPSAVAKVLHEAGYRMEEVATQPHPQRETRFERATPNSLWQTDLFTFILKRQNRRVYLVAFMDDHSRFIVGYGLHASQSSALVIEVLRASLSAYNVPQEILTDNGSQYVTWRGTSAFSRECEKRGIKQIVASPRRPQTLGKIERFWGTLWRECVESAVFIDLGDARQRIGHFIDHYNFSRPHQGIEGLVPADRFFGAASEVKKTLAARVQANALELARHGVPKAPFYMTGQAGGQPFSVHAEGERVILTNADGRKEIDLLPPSAPAESAAGAMPEPLCPQGIAAAFAGEGFEEPPGPGESPLDADLAKLRDQFAPREGSTVGHVSDLSGKVKGINAGSDQSGQVGDLIVTLIFPGG